MDADALFRETYGQSPAVSGFVPGRVNLIGEHTDYNGGSVLPLALKLGIEAALRPRGDDRLRVVSAGFDGTVERRLDEDPSGHWSDYALGAVRVARTQGWLDGGADIALHSNLPAGAGLSSSAALSVALLKLARDHVGARADDVAIARFARSVETGFIGVPCGIMDQMAVALAEPGRALHLDTDSLRYALLDAPEDPAVVVLHSGVHRKLSDGHYAERFAECERIKAVLGRADICRAPLSDLERLDDPVLTRRLRHCITEHARTDAAAAALRAGDFARLGALMVESHASMRDDFQITVPAIDALVATCTAQGALSARMTGGGFGGCIVALVAKADLDRWLDAVLAAHADAYPVIPARGEAGHG